jgi:hypothetical protein
MAVSQTQLSFTWDFVKEPHGSREGSMSRPKIRKVVQALAVTTAAEDGRLTAGGPVSWRRVVGGHRRRAAIPTYGVLVLAAALAAAMGSPPAAHAQDAGAQTSCAHAVGPFKDSGTKVLQGNGSVFIPYGITVTGLAHQNYQDYTAADDTRIAATASDWCANTVRLQVAQDNLVGAKGTAYSAAFMSAIKAEVSLAESNGLVVVINAQTEDVSPYEPGPTKATAVFWKDLIGVYGADPQVVFDLFNEPRINTGSAAGTWHMWQQGGIYQGVTYLGEQTLVNDVRTDGAPNLVWIEAPYAGSNLDEVGSHPIRGGPLMYDIHHPAGAHNSTVWWNDFGYLVKQGIAPVVVGEWTNYASTKSECWSDAPQAVPNFLTYLQNHGIGMTAWELADGVLVESAALNDPTYIKTNWSCTNGLNEGAGHQIMSWYERQNA